jgi:hypothetical protein
MKEAAKALLNEGAKFGIKWLGKEWKFSIKPLYLGTIIKISEHSSSLSELDLNDAVASMLKSKDNLKALSKIVACAILNNRFKLRFSGIFAWWLMYRLTPKELHSIALVVVKQMSVEDFFFTTRLIGGANLLMTKEEVENQSGAASRE